jgi:2-polyprenyl-3-methyl-5-hydroxy-6-metoxy-1,4-benzoquinol methylase
LIIHNYIYKGFSVERQARKLLKKYNVFKELIEALPEKGKVLVPNCGYGVLALTIALVKKNLEIIGIDSDEDKINLAGHCISKPLNLTYLVTEEYTGPLDVIVLLTDNKRQNDKWSKRPCEKKVNGSYFTLLIIGQHE